MHVKCSTRTIDRNLVRMFLDSQANKFISVAFYKVNGDLVTRSGQLKATSRLIGNARGKAQSAAMKERRQVWLSTFDQKSGKPKSTSFFLDRVHTIRAGKSELTANQAT